MIFIIFCACGALELQILQFDVFPWYCPWKKLEIITHFSHVEILSADYHHLKINCQKVLKTCDFYPMSKKVSS